MMTRGQPRGCPFLMDEILVILKIIFSEKKLHKK
jgi:hypothetical protein